MPAAKAAHRQQCSVQPQHVDTQSFQAARLTLLLLWRCVAVLACCLCLQAGLDVLQGFQQMKAFYDHLTINFVGAAATIMALQVRRRRLQAAVAAGLVAV